MIKAAIQFVLKFYFFVGVTLLTGVSNILMINYFLQDMSGIIYIREQINSAVVTISDYQMWVVLLAFSIMLSSTAIYVIEKECKSKRSRAIRHQSIRTRGSVHPAAKKNDRAFYGSEEEESEDGEYAPSSQSQEYDSDYVIDENEDANWNEDMRLTNKFLNIAKEKPVKDSGRIRVFKEANGSESDIHHESSEGEYEYSLFPSKQMIKEYNALSPENKFTASWVYGLNEKFNGSPNEDTINTDVPPNQAELAAEAIPSGEVEVAD